MLPMPSRDGEILKIYERNSTGFRARGTFHVSIFIHHPINSRSRGTLLMERTFKNFFISHSDSEDRANGNLFAPYDDISRPTDFHFPHEHYAQFQVIPSDYLFIFHFRRVT